MNRQTPASRQRIQLDRYIPAMSWLRSYRRADLGGDMTAGVIVAVMLIPQGMAYAALAGLPPVAGLYASTIPLLLYALFGSSRQLAVGPVAIVSLLTLSGVQQLAEPGSASFVAYALLLALMVGVIQLVMGLIRGGAVVKFLSHAVISGFTSAAAIIIGLSQIKNITGIDIGSHGNVYLLIFDAARNVAGVHLPTLVIGASSIATLVLLRRWNRRIPGALFIVVVSTVAVYLFALDAQGVGIVGDVPSGLPVLSAPDFDLSAVRILIPAALTVAFVGYMESIAVAQSIAAREKQRVGPNQEMRALGIANIGAAFFGGYPITGGFSRSAVNYQAGAKSGLASIITAGLILITLLLFTDLFYYLPRAVLGAIVVVAVAGLVDWKELVHLYRIRRTDAATLLLTFAATLTIGIELGILVGIAFSLLLFIWRSAHPHTAEMGYLPEENVFRNVLRYPEVRTFPEAVILRIDESLYFANSRFLKDRIREALHARPEVRWIILDFWSVNDMDAVAIETLEDLMAQYRMSGCRFLFAGVKGPVRDLMLRAGWGDTVSHDMWHLSIQHALDAAGIDYRQPQNGELTTSTNGIARPVARSQGT
ncbi:sulfate permease [soil metagenome]